MRDNTHDELFIKRIEVKDDKIIFQATNNNFNDTTIASCDIKIIRQVCGVFLKV